MKYYVAIRSILDGVGANWADFLFEEMLEWKHTVRNALAYQSYIMALIRSKVSF